jgi:hypothetical protein
MARVFLLKCFGESIMTNVITYHSDDASPFDAWLGFVVLPNGNNLMIHFTGPSEEAVKAKATSFYETEIAKVKAQPFIDSPVADPWTVASGRGAHFAGKTWVMNVVSREKRRVEPSEADSMIASGEWIKAGPRSK